MNFDTKEPCKTCPYRKDVPVGTWHPIEFKKLLVEDTNQFGAIYACHQTRTLPEQQVCGGWLLDQKRRNAPCLTLRVRLMTDDAAAKTFNEIKVDKLKLYPSIAAMCRANGVRVPRR